MSCRILSTMITILFYKVDLNLQAAACFFLAHFELFMQERENFHSFELQYISGNDVEMNGLKNMFDLMATCFK